MAFRPELGENPIRDRLKRRFGVDLTRTAAATLLERGRSDVLEQRTSSVDPEQRDLLGAPTLTPSEAAALDIGVPSRRCR
jgi:hypothetical protein